MTFVTTCVNALGPDINEMTRAATQISRRTFLSYVNRASMARLERELGYGRDSGLVMSKDWNVSYFRSTYQERPCVYFCWSAIEHIFAA